MHLCWPAGGAQSRGLGGVIAGGLVALTLGACGSSGPVYRVPSAAMLPTLPIGSAISVNTNAGPIRVGQIVVFHPPHGADQDFGPECGSPSEGFSPGTGEADAQPCDQPTRDRSNVTFVKRVVGLPGDSRYFGPVPRDWIIGVVNDCSHASRFCTQG